MLPFLPTATKIRYVLLHGLALGGAERIVLDSLLYLNAEERKDVHLVLYQDREVEYYTPPNIAITRFHGDDVALATWAQQISGQVVVTHLIREKQLRILWKAGVETIPVMHNAAEGWDEPIQHLNQPHVRAVVAISYACRDDLILHGLKRPIYVIRHTVSSIPYEGRVRKAIRNQYGIRKLLIGMVGSFKPQKHYVRAISVLAELRQGGIDAQLMIVGGYSNKKSKVHYQAVLHQMGLLHMSEHVILTGFQKDVTPFYSAFDVFLNTSLYEGLSISTLEALSNGLGVVCTPVGGQPELQQTYLQCTAEPFVAKEVAVQVQQMCKLRNQSNHSPQFFGNALWNLLHDVPKYSKDTTTTFITANLNPAGAQRSLVNLLLALPKNETRLLVCSESSAPVFCDQLLQAGVEVSQVHAQPYAMISSQTILRYLQQVPTGRICFWNVDVRIKLILTKFLAPQGIPIIEVSPGAYMFDSIEQNKSYTENLSFLIEEYFRELKYLVFKHAQFESNLAKKWAAKSYIIPNGVPASTYIKKDYLVQRPKILVCGRIAPSKQLEVILQAMPHIWKENPTAELHFVGQAESYDQKYDTSIQKMARDSRILFLGQRNDTLTWMHEYDLLITLGVNQGCPNTVLEALQCGLPVIANDSGGTRELILHQKTGWLLPEKVTPKSLTSAVLYMLQNRSQVQTMANAGLKHIQQFSMQRMKRQYSLLFNHPWLARFLLTKPK